MSELSNQLRIHEGVRSHVYRCTSGLETIGVGRCVAEGSLGLSDDEIDYLLENDIKRCKQELTTFSWFIDLDSVRQDAMVNLCFNLGLSRLTLFSNALSAMADSNYERAAMEFLDSKWARQVGHRSEEVAHMIRTGRYPS
jgi:lysozyme